MDDFDGYCRKLRSLKELRDDGVLSDTEFAAMKARLLSLERNRSQSELLGVETEEQVRLLAAFVGLVVSHMVDACCTSVNLAFIATTFTSHGRERAVF